MTQASHCSISHRLLPLILVLLMVSAPAAAQTPQPFVRDALLDLEFAIGGPIQATVSPTTGLVTFLSFAPDQELFVKLPETAPAEERARAFLDDHGAVFGILGRDWATMTRVNGPDELGMEHVRFRQTHRGVPVTGGELIVHLRGSAVLAANGKTLSDLDHVETNPIVDPLAAAEAVRQFLDRRLGVTEAELSEPRLELLNRGLLEGRRGWTRLVWFVEASAIDLREFVWVDAASGAPLLHFSQLTDGRDRQIYDADDPNDGVYGDLPGTLVRSEGEGPTGDGDADDAYDYSGDTYDYFWSQHGRDSYDDAGATLISTVHFCPSAASCPFVNAFWNGTQMVYGEGFPAADDVDAHELTHAVTEFSANLFYYMQSGALSESFSDVFGETVDLTNSGGTDTPGVRWLMGEDVPGIGAIRDMMDPTAFGDPGKMSDGEFFCGDDYREDQGGVHFNSGVPNHAYALMVDGGSYNGETITGMGLTKAGKIWYRTLVHYLISSSDFLDAFNSLIQSCQDLVGVAGITSGNCTEVNEALDAVEMSSPWPCPPAQGVVPDFCPSGQAPTLWHYWDIETSSLPACPPDGVLSSWCVEGPTSLLGPYATSGVKSYWGYNRPEEGLMGVTVNSGITSLPSGARMQFNHSHGFENTGTSYWDGGQVRYSTDGGSSWTDGGSLITGGQTYGGTVSSCCLNPLGGSGAFVADSWGYTASQLDLSSLAGQPFRYRFDVGTDFSIDEYGWFVDDIRIFTCAACVATRVLDAAYNGLSSFYGASVSVEAGSGFSVGAMESVTLEAPEVRLTDDFNGYGELTIGNATCP
jgi:Zn-dependent metalloprotease